MTADVGMPVTAPPPGGVRVERVVTSGTFELDGGSWEVDNNVWLVGDDTECSSSTPRTTPGAILDVDRRAPGRRGPAAPTRTTTTSTRVGEVVRRRPRATAYLHPDDRVLWDQTLAR